MVIWENGHGQHLRKGEPRSGSWIAIVKESKRKGQRTTLTITMKGLVNLNVPVTNPAFDWKPWKRLKRMPAAQCKP